MSNDIEIYIKKNYSKNITPIKVNIKKCNTNDVIQLLKLKDIITNNLPNSELFESSSAQDFIKNMEGKNNIFACIVDNVIIAYAIIIFPDYDKENLGYDLGINLNELCLVAHLDTVVVHPKYRGNQLQKYLCNIIEREAYLKGAKYLCATVSPQNVYSLKNFIDSNYDIVIEKIKYNNKSRFILMKKIR
jgi:hypothetical protein